MHRNMVVLLDAWLGALRDFNLEAILLHHLDYEECAQERIDIYLRCLGFLRATDM